MNFIPLVTDEFRVTFCRATEPLCSDVRRIIWEKLLYDNIELEPPNAPEKCRIKYSRVSGSCLPRQLFEHLSPNQWRTNIKTIEKLWPQMKPEKR